MILNEVIKPFLKTQKTPELSSAPLPDKNLQILDDEPLYGNQFFDNDFLGLSQSQSPTALQGQKIDIYRKVAQRPEVQEGIQEIVNEVIFTQAGEDILKVQANLDNEKLQEALSTAFDKIANLMSLDKRIFNIVKQGYVDGQLVFHVQYNPKKIKNGIQGITMLDPRGLLYEPKTKRWVYEGFDSNANMNKKFVYSPEEIVRVDFGLREEGLILSHLEQTIKVSNMLQALEDMLVPLRFSRSISRRVFNVDIGDLPPRRGQAVMRQYQNEFKYKKFYNQDTGEITNNQHITSMVEDYWFQNRSGGKGTQVDVLDESGNLGELDDIIYMQKKLYKSMGIPQSRQATFSSDYRQETDFGQTVFTSEDVQFYLFISRLRKVYSEVFRSLLKLEIISTGIMTVQEYEEHQSQIKVVFASENIYLDKMKMHLFSEKISNFRDQMDYQGKIFSQKTQIKKIFNMTDEEIIEEMKQIKEEKKDELFQHLYDDEY